MGWSAGSQIFGRKRRSACVPPDERVYAIGDVHGEAKLLNWLLARIESDLRERPAKKVTLLFLGDLIDRGPDSNTLLRSMRSVEELGVIMLKGNHEQALVDAYRGDDRALEFWLQYGGVATLNSFGIHPDGTDFPRLREFMHMAIEPDLIEWLDTRPTSHCIGDYLFVHAGIRPNVPLEEQVVDDLLWIRDPFLRSKADHSHIVVHGHTIVPAPVRLGGNRIGIDTGGHEYGRLTALGLEDAEQWIVEVDDEREPDDQRA